MGDAAPPLSAPQLSPTRSPRPGSPAGVRPRWWAVLAVVLALMALVAAVSHAPGRQRLPGSRTSHRAGVAEARPVRGHGAPGGTGVPALAPADSTDSTGGGGPGGGGPGATDSARVPGGTRLPTPSAGATAAPPAPTTLPQSAAATTTVTSPTLPVNDGSGGTSLTTIPGPIPGPGNLVAPTRSATWSVSADGPLSAHASWTGTPSLTLALSCPGQPPVTDEGSSPLAVALTTAGPASCTVTLSTPAPLTSAVSYTVVIDPPPAA